MADVPPILTEHLQLDSVLPATLEALLRADLAGASTAQGIELAPEFADSVDELFLRIQLERMTKNPAGRGWCVRTVVRRGDGKLLGHCGFHGPPEDIGRAEIGYGILPPHRGRGYATESAAALVRYGFEHGADAVFASVSPTNAPSLRVVAKLGFVQTGIQMDEVDGEELVFELQRPAYDTAT